MCGPGILTKWPTDLRACLNVPESYYWSGECILHANKQPVPGTTEDKSEESAAGYPDRRNRHSDYDPTLEKLQTLRNIGDPLIGAPPACCK